MTTWYIIQCIPYYQHQATLSVSAAYLFELISVLRHLKFETYLTD